jgi:hypothetical protein
VGVCGLDCGLCPRYYIEGASRCPGCAGPDFFTKHPSCGFVTCCFKKKGLEICSQCAEFPCPKFEGAGTRDSFIIYRNVMNNLRFIEKNGIDSYYKIQRVRMDLLVRMLDAFNDGRSKSFYCISAALLSIIDLERALEKAETTARARNIEDRKERAMNLKQLLQEAGDREGVELILRK